MMLFCTHHIVLLYYTIMYAHHPQFFLTLDLLQELEFIMVHAKGCAFTLHPLPNSALAS